jgi:hypothetical protein
MALWIILPCPPEIALLILAIRALFCKLEKVGAIAATGKLPDKTAGRNFQRLHP